MIPVVHTHALVIALSMEATWRESTEMTGSKDWPHGYCVDASVALLEELGQKLPEAGAEYIWGTFVTKVGPGPVFAIEHAWLELVGGFVLDITVGQFFKKTPPLPLITPNSLIHPRYVVTERAPAWSCC
ncbi:MAG TPA: hypothetical protein VGV69_01115 [Solirubrobacterales bacterium]|nr:hypothetical protein [Solirubrobacterales bacterium]